jgi:hypothetical protein
VRKPDLTARVLADGTVLLGVGDESLVVDGGGVRQKLAGRAWSVVTIDKKLVGATESIMLHEIASPKNMKGWTLGVHDSPEDRFGIAIRKGQPTAWS